MVPHILFDFFPPLRNFAEQTHRRGPGYPDYLELAEFVKRNGDIRPPRCRE
jgi:hypothetical protein